MLGIQYAALDNYSGFDRKKHWKDTDTELLSCYLIQGATNTRYFMAERSLLSHVSYNRLNGYQSSVHGIAFKKKSE